MRAVLAILLLVPAFASAQDTWGDPFPGVRHLHRRTSNQDLHVLLVDLCAAGVSVRTTGSGERRQTPSSFGSNVGAQIAVNGDFFNYADYSTDGPAMSGGAAWGGADHGYVTPVAFGDRRVSMAPHEAGGAPEPWMREIVSGHPTILAGGAVRDNSGDPLCTNRHPRTALGLSADRRTLFVMVVDGRATTRIGMTCDELAITLRDLGASDATNMDGGGSSAMWLAGAGVVSHPSDGNERVVANHLAIYATGSGAGAHCPNAAPDGWLDDAGCERIHGWARDTDVPGAPIDVHVYVGGPAGDPNAVAYAVRADDHRDDLCTAIGHCAHAFSLLTPHAFLDGVERPVFAYGIDAMGGANPLLSGAPRTLRCDRPALPSGVRRHVSSPEVMAAWRFDAHDVITLSDAELDAIDEGDPIPAAPRLFTVDGDPRVFVEDGTYRRHVPSPAAMDAWRFDWAAIQSGSSAIEDGAPLHDRPWLVRGSGPAIYLLDTPPAIAELDAGVPIGDAGIDLEPPPPDLDDPPRGLRGACSAGSGSSPWPWLAIAIVFWLRRR